MKIYVKMDANSDPQLDILALRDQIFEFFPESGSEGSLLNLGHHYLSLVTFPFFLYFFIAPVSLFCPPLSDPSFSSTSLLRFLYFVSFGVWLAWLVCKRDNG